MIHTVSSIIDTDTHHGTEVTVRCTVTSGPKAGSRGGEKTLYDVDTGRPDYNGDAFLSVWQGDPSWAEHLDETAPYIQELLDELPLQEGETVLARGVPNIHNDKWYLNVTSLVIRDPETLIGKSEMRSANECPRIYNLAFEKHIYSPGRYDLSTGSMKGRIVHSMLEEALNDEQYRQHFQTGWTESEIDACLSDVLESDYAIELALCRLAWISTNRIKEYAREAVVPLFTDDEFSRHIADANNVSTEVALSSALGFNGRVDIIVDGVPYDLKTAYSPTESQRDKNRFQLRIYLLALTLESLDPGETLSERVAEGIEGVLVYPSLANNDGVELERVELRERDIESILQLRNEAAVLRDGFGVPTTYERNCEGCTFKDPTEVGAGSAADEALPSPCKFYCQSERRWECFETNDQGDVITQCPLFDECEQRLDFRSPKVTDHYNQLRSALNAERTARRNLGTELEHSPDDTLMQAGLLVPDLSLSGVAGQRRLYLESDMTVAPSFAPGDEIRLHQRESDYYQMATYHGREDGQYIFQLDATPTRAFLDPTTSFEARYTMSVSSYPRDLLSQLDYAQRAEVTPLLQSTGIAGDALEHLELDDLQSVQTQTTNKEVYVNVPIRPDRTETVATIVEALSTADLEYPSADDKIPDDEQRVLVLSSAPNVTDAITDRLAAREGTVRLDGFAGGEATTVTPSMDAHEIYTAVDEANVLVSSMRYALVENIFHAMRSGDLDARPHSDRFFDAVVLAGAQTLTEPQFHFLRVLGDRLFAVGDTHRSGPTMVSGEAQESRLDDSYFNRLYRRFANIENPDSQSLVVPARLIDDLTDPFSSLDVPLTSIEGEIEFVDADGTTESALHGTTLDYRFPCDGPDEEPRFLRLMPVEKVDLTQVSSTFDSLRTLDAGEFTVKNTYRIQDIRFEVQTNNPADGGHHEVKIEVPVRATPFLNQLLTHNPGEARAVVKACQDTRPNAIVTPFAAHANEIRTALSDAGMDIPVYLPDELSGEQFNETVVSFGISDDNRIVMPPVNEIETLYLILNSGRNVTVIGDLQTLERNSVLASLL